MSIRFYKNLYFRILEMRG